jgi:adenylate kinase
LFAVTAGSDSNVSGRAGPNLVLIGPPGAGKGSLAEKLCSLNIEHVSSGGIFRGEVARKTALGGAIEKSLARGEFVPDEATLAVMRKWYFARKNRLGFLLDGFPRNLLQAQALGEWMETRRETLVGVLFLELSETEAFRRVTERRVCPRDGMVYHLTNRPPVEAGRCDRCGDLLVQRSDDSAATFRHRWDLFERFTRPVTGYYAAQGLLFTVDASVSLDAVLAEVMDRVQSLC